MTFTTDTRPPRSPAPLAMILAAGLLLLVGLVGVLAWVGQGPDMFLALAQSGLALCL